MVMKPDRRRFLAASAAIGAATLSPQVVLARPEAASNEQDEAEITATEDLMREHGVLDRLLLIFEEGLRRLQSRQEVSAEIFHAPAVLIRKFVEDYHEKLEEGFIFPIFEKQGKMLELVKILRQQHEVGRALTDAILLNSAADQFAQDGPRREAVRACEAFLRMYRPHKAREDTVLFPALHLLITDKQLDQMGDRFEAEENRVFGKDGFERTVDRVAALERQWGIGDLSQFTAKVSS